MSESARVFARETNTRQYGKPFRHDLHRVPDIRYKRFTLVAKSGGERMTLDTDLQFWFGDKSYDVGAGVFIVETETRLGRGDGDKCLRRANVRLTKRCSIY